LIVVADSSPTPACESNRKIVTSLRDVLNIRHEQYSPDTYIPSKIAQALGTVDSEYSVVCPDDDFIVPQAVEECVRFLKSNPDYEVAHGHSMRVCAVELIRHGRTRLLTFSPVEPSTPRSKLWSCELSQHTIDDPDPGSRLQEHLFNYAATMYSVHRRSNLKRNMQLAANLTKDYWFGELLPSCLSMVQGKLKCLETLFQVRPYNVLDSARESINEIMPYYTTLLTFDDFSQRYSQFRNCLAEELVDALDKPMAEVKDIVNQAFLSYLTHNILQPVYGGQSSQGDMATYKRQIKRAKKAIRMLRIAANITFHDGGLTTLLKSPRQFARRTYLEQAMSARGYISVDNLLSIRSPFRSDLSPIYDHLFVRHEGSGTRAESI